MDCAVSYSASLVHTSGATNFTSEVAIERHITHSSILEVKPSFIGSDSRTILDATKSRGIESFTVIVVRCAYKLRAYCTCVVFECVCVQAGVRAGLCVSVFVFFKIYALQMLIINQLDDDHNAGFIA